MNDDTQLARWLAGQLDNDELEVLKNSPRYATLVRIQQNFALIERPNIEDDKMMETIFKQEKRKPKVVPLYSKVWFKAVAASIVIIIGLGIIFTLPQKNSAPNGQTMAFALPDASKVILNAGSQSHYSSLNWDDNRSVDLTGEAYFEVAKGKTFAVHTNLGTVTVLGTHFNVKARGSRFDVVCYEGRVRVQFNGHTTILTAHKGLTVDNGILTGAVTTVTNEKPAWLTGELVFTKEKLAAVIAELERKYDVQINADYRSNQTFTGYLPTNNIDSALRSLALLYPFKVEKRGDTILLKPVDGKK